MSGFMMRLFFSNSFVPAVRNDVGLFKNVYSQIIQYIFSLECIACICYHIINSHCLLDNVVCLVAALKMVSGAIWIHSKHDYSVWLKRQAIINRRGGLFVS